MTARPTVRGAPSALSARRIILLTTISGLAAAALFVGVGIKLDPRASPPLTPPRTSSVLPGFADLVAKVKPVGHFGPRQDRCGAKMMKFDGGSTRAAGLAFEQFFRRFGMPDGVQYPAEARPSRPTHRPGLGLLHRRRTAMR